MRTICPTVLAGGVTVKPSTEVSGKVRSVKQFLAEHLGPRAVEHGHAEVRKPIAAAVGPIPEDDRVDAVRASEVDLPPGVLIGVGGVGHGTVVVDPSTMPSIARYGIPPNPVLD